MKTRLFFAITLTVSLLTSSFAFADELSVEINGQKIDTESIVVNDRTLVPVRTISEALNCDIAWDGETKGVNIYKNNRIYTMWLEHDTAFKLSPTSLEGFYDLDTPPIIINDRTMLPLRAIGELLGAEVGWNNETKTASLTLAVTEENNAGIAEKLLAYEKAMKESYEAYDRYVHGETEKVNAVIKLKNGKSIELELYPELAPETVENFVELVEKDFYDGLIFHRVISGFMVQGGGYDVNGKEPQTSNIYGEFISNGFFNLLKHERGVISMARTPIPDSASSQFFIMHEASPHLDGEYAAFGRVTSGIEVIDEIASAKTDSNDKPIEDIVIESVTITQ